MPALTRLAISRRSSGTSATLRATPARMVVLVGRVMIDKPINRPTVNQPNATVMNDDCPSSEVDSRNAPAAKIVTKSVATSLITSDEYVMNTGERASVSAAIAAASRPNVERASQKTPKTETIPKAVESRKGGWRVIEP